MKGPGGTFSLADAEGRAVVLQFGPADSDAWVALEEAHADLEAAGALVVGAVTEGSAASLRLPFAMVSDPDGEVAISYGFTGRPLVVVIDAEGRLRSRSESVESTDQFFDLAASALLEADELDAPYAPASETREPVDVSPEEVADLVRDGAALLDLRTDVELEREGAIANALHIAPEAVSPDVLPVNALTPIIFAGADGPRIALDAIFWGFHSVYVIEDASALADPDAELLAPEADDVPPSRLPNQRRAIG